MAEAARVVAELAASPRQAVVVLQRAAAVGAAAEAVEVVAVEEGAVHRAVEVDLPRQVRHLGRPLATMPSGSNTTRNR